MEISKKDWELFREKLPEWQEHNMENLNREYIKLLQKEGNASDKFWELEKRIRNDKKKTGVILELRKSELIFDLVSLLREGVIEVEDLEGFSDELKEVVIEKSSATVLYGHAVLGESIELYKDAIAWGQDQQKNIEKNVVAE